MVDCLPHSGPILATFLDEIPGRMPSKRGISCMFGPDVTEKFLKHNNLGKFFTFDSDFILELVVRSHEVKHEGYEY